MGCCFSSKSKISPPKPYVRNDNLNPILKSGKFESSRDSITASWGVDPDESSLSHEKKKALNMYHSSHATLANNANPHNHKSSVATSSPSTPPPLPPAPPMDSFSDRGSSSIEMIGKDDDEGEIDGQRNRGEGLEAAGHLSVDLPDPDRPPPAAPHQSLSTVRRIPPPPHARRSRSSVNDLSPDKSQDNISHPSPVSDAHETPYSPSHPSSTLTPGNSGTISDPGLPVHPPPIPPITSNHHNAPDNLPTDPAAEVAAVGRVSLSPPRTPPPSHAPRSARSSVATLNDPDRTPVTASLSDEVAAVGRVSLSPPRTPPPSHAPRSARSSVATLNDPDKTPVTASLSDEVAAVGRVSLSPPRTPPPSHLNDRSRENLDMNHPTEEFPIHPPPIPPSIPEELSDVYDGESLPEPPVAPPPPPRLPPSPSLDHME